MGYRLLGFTVWKGAKWFLRRRYGHLVPPRKVTAGVLVAVVVAGLAAVQWRGSSSG